MLHDLYSERKVVTLLAEGGAAILRDLLAGNLVDELRLAIAPFFVGDGAAPRFALPARYPHGPADPMALVDVRRLGDVVVARYRAGNERDIMTRRRSCRNHGTGVDASGYRTGGEGQGVSRSDWRGDERR